MANDCKLIEKRIPDIKLGACDGVEERQKYILSNNKWKQSAVHMSTLHKECLAKAIAKCFLKLKNILFLICVDL